MRASGAAENAWLGHTAASTSRPPSVSASARGVRKAVSLARRRLGLAALRSSLAPHIRIVRLAFDDNAIAGTMRWEYGKVVKVHSGGDAAVHGKKGDPPGPVGTTTQLPF